MLVTLSRAILRHAASQRLVHHVHGRHSLQPYRLSTVGIANRVLVVAEGRIVDDGAPIELLSRGSGEFAALYRDGYGLPIRHPVG